MLILTQFFGDLDVWQTDEGSSYPRPNRAGVSDLLLQISRVTVSSTSMVGTGS